MNKSDLGQPATNLDFVYLEHFDTVIRVTDFVRIEIIKYNEKEAEIELTLRDSNDPFKIVTGHTQIDKSEVDNPYQHAKMMVKATARTLAKAGIKVHGT